MAGHRPTPRDNSVIPGPRPDKDETQVIPLHGRGTPPTPMEAPRASGPQRRASVPVDNRPWRLLVVPPTPGAPTRAFDIKRWQAKLAAWTIGILLLIALADVVAVILTVREQRSAPSDAEMDALRSSLIALDDSLTTAQSSLADAESIARDSVAALGIAENRLRVAALTARRRALLAKGESSSLSSTSAGVPNDAASRIEGLPVIGAIASGFSYARKHPILNLTRPHLGVDVAARYGARISAPAPGQVTFVGLRLGYGRVVELDHGGGVTTLYAHCSAVVVRTGQKIAKGQLIAMVGSSGLATGPHLHYEIHVNGRQMNPANFHFPPPVEPAAGPATLGAPPTQVLAAPVARP